MFDELKEVKYFKEIIDFKSLLIKNTLKEYNVCKSRGVSRTQASIYDGAFFVNILHGLLFLQ